jgi:hypothetical protein
MSDINCPYCKAGQEINHDDGYGYEDGEEFEQHCVECGREFKFTTSITFNYDAFCQDGDHIMEPWGDKWPDMYGCARENCEYYECRRAKSNE